jgi:autotransporter translocation and assembly factor TamB
VIVSGGVVTIPERPGTPLLDPRAPPDLVFIGDAAPAAARPPGAPWLVADIVLRDTRVDAASIDGVSFRTSLHSRGKLRLSLGEPIGLIGDVQIDAGDVDLLGRRYTLSPSELAFDGTIDPSVRVQLSHDFSELTLNAVVTGRASHLDRPQLSSDPGGYTDDQLWGFLIGGEPGTDPSTQTRDALVGAAARGLSGTLGKQLSRVLPIQLDVSCEPATTVTRASCSVGKWFSDRMFLTVRQVLDAQPDENASSLDLQYRLGRKSLELSGGDRAHYGADVVWRHRW